MKIRKTKALSLTATERTDATKILFNTMTDINKARYTIVHDKHVLTPALIKAMKHLNKAISRMEWLALCLQTQEDSYEVHKPITSNTAAKAANSNSPETKNNP